ncbi:hypothetical protein EU811_09515 [Arthrobacter sp. TS-15]|uniref:hypothetical protein n=1 Tax=unclassified Arthrobacter TaxID=235627 RepID=UPI00115DAFE9|nr:MULTISPECIES: hypothetical protein [unclassified Arthrobacter]TQS92670.1 hypothetical protein EU811_09515 [Arthrobacter sp. TS-15]BCW64167.1 hypothetical protein StoSoilB22_31400 [Arthrobacter sp. StoSoilB22]
MLIVVHIKEFWDQLSPETQQWLVDNPGTMIVPRTVTAIINAETGEGDTMDAHGGTVLTDEDRHFIQEQARNRVSPSPEPKFFDSVRPED